MLQLDCRLYVVLIVSNIVNNCLRYKRCRSSVKLKLVQLVILLVFIKMSIVVFLEFGNGNSSNYIDIIIILV